jgi:hypothetical protein
MTKDYSNAHPDDFMVVSVSLEFRAKVNPAMPNPCPLDAGGEHSWCLPAADAAEELEALLSAIHERRLYGFMVQRSAELPVGCGEWIEKTDTEYVEEMRLSGRIDGVAHDHGFDPPRS